jgi:hypothetical protein
MDLGELESDKEIEWEIVIQINNWAINRCKEWSRYPDCDAKLLNRGGVWVPFPPVFQP